MPTDKQVNLVDHGICVTHDQLCIVRGCDRKAVLDLNSGLYLPCGYHRGMVRPVRWQRWYERMVARATRDYKRRWKQLPKAKAQWVGER